MHTIFREWWDDKCLVIPYHPIIANGNVNCKHYHFFAPKVILITQRPVKSRFLNVELLNLDRCLVELTIKSWDNLLNKLNIAQWKNRVDITDTNVSLIVIY